MTAYREACADMAVTEAQWAADAKRHGDLGAYRIHTRAVIRLAATVEAAMGTEAHVADPLAAVHDFIARKGPAAFDPV